VMIAKSLIIQGGSFRSIGDLCRTESAVRIEIDREENERWIRDENLWSHSRCVRKECFRREAGDWVMVIKK
jgi:hypothetical protein